jgi:hypothetical protein
MGNHEPAEAAAPAADSRPRALTAHARRLYQSAFDKQRELETEMRRLGETLDRMEAAPAPRR